MFEFILFFLIMVAGTGGELCMARAMRTMGEVTDFRPKALIGVVGRAVRVPWTWIGLGLMTVAFFSLLGVLAVENVSFVVPVTALSYVVGTVGGKVFLHENITKPRWMGVILVCLGVTLVLLGKA
ncbi:MAG TPA: EamA family transporter [Terriglobales bacterium]|jgi:multidrug transporter EmrE-like cation transporter|nr:EamA family transporter [Terriglobales bacterium]